MKKKKTTENKKLLKRHEKKAYFGIRAGAAQNILSVSFKASRAGRDPK